MHFWLISLRNLKHKKLRTWLTLITIMFSVTTVMTMVSTVETTKKVVPKFVQSENENIDFRAYGKDFLFTEDASKQIKSANKNIITLASLAFPASIQNHETPARAILTGYDNLENKLLNYQILSGNLHSKGLIISETSAAILGLTVGDPLLLNINHTQQSIQIAAIVKDHSKLNGPQSWSSTWNFSISLEALQNILHLQGQISLIEIKAEQPTDLALLQKKIADKLQETGPIYLQHAFTELDQTLNETKTVFTGLYLVSTLGLLVCLFILFNSFYVTALERKKEIVIMKTFGYTPNKIRFILLQEILLLALISTLPGIGLGMLLTQGLQGLLFGPYNMNTQVDYTFLNGMFIAAISGIGVPLLAALIPVYTVSQTSVVNGLKQNDLPMKTKNIYVPIFGTLLMVIGTLALTLTKLILPLSLIPICIGFVFISPQLLASIHWLVTPINVVLLGNEGRIASRNISRQINRIGTTSAILSLGVCLIVVISSFQSSILNSMEDLIRKTFGADISLELATPVTKDDISQIKRIHGVQSALSIKSASVSWHTSDKKGVIQILGLDQDIAKDFHMMEPIDQTYPEITAHLSNPKSIILSKKAFDDWGGRLGESIELDTFIGKKTLSVVGVVTVAINNGYAAFTSNEAFGDTFGIQFAKVAFVNISSKHEANLIKAEIVQIMDEKIESINTLEEIVVQGRSYIQSTFGIISKLLSLGMLISAIGIINTLLINVIDRLKELAMLRAIGYTRAQIRKMIIGEGMIMGVSGVIFGACLGLIIAYLFAASGNELIAFRLLFTIPWSTIVFTAIFGVSISLLASLIPASRATKINMIDALK